MNTETIINKLLSNYNAYIELKVRECLKKPGNIGLKKELEETYRLDSMLGVLNNDYLPINVLLKKISIFLNVSSSTEFNKKNDIDKIKTYYTKNLYNDEIKKYKNLLLIHHSIISKLIEKKEIQENSKTSVMLSNDLILIKQHYSTLEQIENNYKIEVLEKLEVKILIDKNLEKFQSELETLEKELKKSLKEDYVEVDEKDPIKKYIYLQYLTKVFFEDDYNLINYLHSIIEENDLPNNVEDINNLMIKLRTVLNYADLDRPLILYLIEKYQKLQMLLYNYLIKNPDQIEKYSIKNEHLNKSNYFKAIEERKKEIEKKLKEYPINITEEKRKFLNNRNKLYNLVLKKKSSEEILNSNFLLELLERITDEVKLINCFYKKVSLEEVLDIELVKFINILDCIKFKEKVPFKNILLFIAGLDEDYKYILDLYNYINPKHCNEVYQLEGIEYINFKSEYTNYLRINIEKEVRVVISKDTKKIDNYFNIDQKTKWLKLEEGVEEITIEDNKYQLLYGGYSEIIIPNSIKKIKVNDFKSINSFVFENYKEQGEEFIIKFVNNVYKVLEDKILKGYEERIISIILKDNIEEIKLDLPPNPLFIPLQDFYYENITNIKKGKKETLKEIENIFEKEKVYKK